MTDEEILQLRRLRRRGYSYRELYRMFKGKHSKMAIRMACGVNAEAIREAKKFNRRNYFIASVKKRLYIEKRDQFKD